MGKLTLPLPGVRADDRNWQVWIAADTEVTPFHLPGKLATPKETAAGLIYAIKRRTELHPLSGLNDRLELLPFFHREYRELQGLVRRFGVRGTENSYNSHASFIAAEREYNNSVCGCDRLPKAQNVMPAAVAHAIKQLG